MKSTRDLSVHSIAGFSSHLRERHTLEPGFPQECPEPKCAQCFLRRTDLTVHLSRRHQKSKVDLVVAVNFSGPWVPAACPNPDCLELPHVVFHDRYSLLYHLLTHHHMMVERGFSVACLCPYSAYPDRATHLESPLPAKEGFSVTLEGATISDGRIDPHLDDLFGAETGLSGASEGAIIPDAFFFQSSGRKYDLCHLCSPSELCLLVVHLWEYYSLYYS